MATNGAGGGPQSAGAGPQAWGFMPTGPTQPIALAATTVTVTLNQFVSTAPYAPQCGFWNIGAAAANSLAFVAFGSSTVTVSNTVGTPIAPAFMTGAFGGTQAQAGLQVLTTGKRPAQYLAIGSAGTTTVYITPGEGSH